jgi:hypothetical protein
VGPPGLDLGPKDYEYVTAHIAGRLGINTYLKVPKSFGYLWYRNEAQEQSKWYPSITILRQKKDMTWSEAI